MPRAELDLHLDKIDDLIAEIETLVPPGAGYQAIKFRADLAGLLVVAVAATYETCVKTVLYSYANGHHAEFGSFAERNYSKLNSKIQVSDLKRYCSLFSPDIRKRFDKRLSSKKQKILERTGSNIETCYDQILTWRHDFAHAWNRNSTIEEAARTHMAAKRIIYVFDDSFNRK